MRYIDIDKNLIPYEFEMTLANELFRFKVNYNEEFDYFTIDLFKDDIPLIYGEKIVYGRPLFLSCLEGPKLDIVLYDVTGRIERVTYENFNKEVFLFLVGDEDETI